MLLEIDHLSFPLNFREIHDVWYNFLTCLIQPSDSNWLKQLTWFFSKLTPTQQAELIWARDGKDTRYIDAIDAWLLGYVISWSEQSSFDKSDWASKA